MSEIISLFKLGYSVKTIFKYVLGNFSPKDIIQKAKFAYRIAKMVYGKQSIHQILHSLAVQYPIAEQLAWYYKLEMASKHTTMEVDLHGNVTVTFREYIGG